MRKKLKDVAAIQVGYTFRAPLSSLNPGDVAVIQVKNLTPENRVSVNKLMKIQMESPKEHHLVQLGDMVFKSRENLSRLGEGSFTSAILDKDPGVAVVAGPLFRIRVSDRLVLPEYLNWFLCQPSTQNVLVGLAMGSVQQMISKGALENLEIPIPPLEQQRAIVAMASLGEEEQALMGRIAELRKKIISADLIQLAKGE